MLVSQQYRAFSDCTDVQAGLARKTFSNGRIRVYTMNPFSYLFHAGIFFLWKVSEVNNVVFIKVKTQVYVVGKLVEEGSLAE